MENKSFEALKRNFFDTAVADVYRAIDGGSLMGAFILTHCLIDYGGALFYGKNPKRIVRWIDNFLTPQSSLYGIKEVQVLIKDIRNGLLHSYGSIQLRDEFSMGIKFVSNPRFGNHLLHDPYLNGRVISLYYLLPHVTIGLWETFDQIKALEPNNFLKEIIPVEGRKEDISGKKYGSMHHALGCLDINNIQCEFIQSKLDIMLSPKSY